ncbi:MAG TPA: phosphoenolpyruvate--protein phosphotransferase [Spirochaetota bacterium]|nr:phosphoenolpyruvate--protein phosphotransferase [Spirochaetota bacterium]HPI23225.1 phosphoenolpyruvate--protein phosphotransferase [Spirochaetota bacterium]HPU88648.1 phosphoenolpyruvate--protein phosphotransferase [Spirochaetota bacterium]
MPQRIKGTVASPGIRIGKAYVYQTSKVYIPKYDITVDQIDAEIIRFEDAIRKTKEEIKSIQGQIATSLSKDMADIFSSHIMMLEDPQIYEKTKELVRSELRNVEWVLNDTALDLMKGFSAIEDEYLRERILDISDIHKRLISNLQKQKVDSVSLANLKEEVIVFASDLTPSDTAMMNKKYVLAFVTDKGGRTSHTAIMARALELPAIVGTMNATSMVRDGDTVICDATHGEVLINPTPELIEEYTRYQEELRAMEIELAKLTSLPSLTVDDEEVFLYGNIELPDEMAVIKEHGAQGIGLFRSEFLFLGRSLPDENTQFCEYRKVVEFFNPLPVTIRTLDVGGDKIFSYTNEYRERNPFLGCRAIRFSLENVDLLRTQIRAVLRASHYGTVKLMFPMVSTVEEIVRAREILDETRDELDRAGIPFDHEIAVGVMIEVPSAVIAGDLLAKHSDFFSVGTNDLIQYTLAVDRISEKVAYLYDPLNISVLRFLKQIVVIARDADKPLSICGEIAGEPIYTMLLLGLGFRHFSMSSASMNQIKRIIRAVRIEDCNRLADELLSMEKAADIERRLMEVTAREFPWLTL